MAKLRILIVEDEFIIAATIGLELKEMGYEVAGTFSSGEETIKNFEQINPDLALLDINLEGEMDGIETGQWIKERSDIPIIYLTGYSNPELQERAKETKPAGFFLKPIELAVLNETIASCISKKDD